jgi:hypothetical protein
MPVANSFTGLGARLNQQLFDAANAPETFGVINQLARPPAGSVVTIRNLESVRATLRYAAPNFNHPRERAGADQAIRHLDDYLPGISPRDVIHGDATAAAPLLRRQGGTIPPLSAAGRLPRRSSTAVGRLLSHSGQSLARQKIRRAWTLVRGVAARECVRGERDAVAEGAFHPQHHRHLTMLIADP